MKYFTELFYPGGINRLRIIMRILWLFIFIVLPIPLSGCVTHSIHPYYTDDMRIPIPAGLAGKWKLISVPHPIKGFGTPQHISPWVIQDKKIVTYDENNTRAEMVLTFFRIGGQLFCDSTPGDPATGNEPNFYWLWHVVPVHLLTRVDINGDTLTLYPLYVEWLEDELKNNWLNKYYIKTKSVGMLFTATPEQWIKFLTPNTANPGAFSDKYKLVLQRVTDTPDSTLQRQ